MDFLNSPATRDLDGAACGEVLLALGRIQAKHAAARAEFLRRFDAADAHDADGYGSSSSWLAAYGQLTKKDARAAVREMRRHTDRPQLSAALRAGAVSQSWADEIAGWTRKLPAGMRTETDRILLGVTFGGAAVLRGDLTPECATAVRAVLEALGKRQGPEDDRPEGKRFHDALQLACTLLLRARLVPDRAGADTQAVVHIPLSQLRDLPGAPEVEEAWVRARAGQDSFLAGPGARAAACDAQNVPVVTDTLDPDVIDKIIGLARVAAEADLARVAAEADLAGAAGANAARRGQPPPRPPPPPPPPPAPAWRGGSRLRPAARDRSRRACRASERRPPR
jgi:hypothetical protein